MPGSDSDSPWISGRIAASVQSLIVDPADDCVRGLFAERLASGGSWHCHTDAILRNYVKSLDYNSNRFKLLISLADRNVVIPRTLTSAFEVADLDAAWTIAEHGFNLNTKDSCGMTPLCVMVRHRTATEIKKLIDFGADINMPSVHGRTPLHHAVDACREGTLIDFLLEEGADPTIVDISGG